MPYKNKEADRQWHKLKMRERRQVAKLRGRVVTPSVTPRVDAEGYPMPDYDAF